MTALYHATQLSFLSSDDPQESSIPEGYKRCSNPACKNPILAATPEFFYRNSRTKDKLDYRCKNCQNEYRSSSEYRAMRAASARRCRAKIPEPIRHNKDKRKHLKEYYDLTLENYQRMLEGQQGLCACCSKSETSFDKKHQTLRRLNVDHCHKTGKIRGLLCGRCNRALGLLEDDPELVKALLRYIDHYAIVPQK
jgi:recombination endonuclease VII